VSVVEERGGSPGWLFQEVVARRRDADPAGSEGCYPARVPQVAGRCERARRRPGRRRPPSGARKIAPAWAERNRPHAPAGGGFGARGRAAIARG
jgi:hypothetical protein